MRSAKCDPRLTCRCAAKQQKPVKAPKSSKAGRGKDSGNTHPRKAGTAAAGPLQDMRTSLGTYHIRSFLESDAAPTKAVLDVIAAHQSTGATCAKHKIEDDAGTVLRGAALPFRRAFVYYVQQWPASCKCVLTMILCCVESHKGNMIFCLSAILLRSTGMNIQSVHA